MAGVFAGSTGRGMGNYTEEQIPKKYHRSFCQNEKFPQKLGPIFFTQCKEVSADPSKTKCTGCPRDSGQKGK